jgi:hypothetical protein
MSKFIRINNGILTETQAAQTSTPNAIPALDGTGKLPVDMLPVGTGAAAYVLPASQALAAGDLVNIWNDDGVAKVRKADNGALATRAHGFVTAAVNNGANATIYTDWTLTKSALTAGANYFLGTAGNTILAAALPTAANAIIQVIGFAVNATTIDIEIADPVVLA